MQAPLRLHIGSGNKRLEGWVNVDLQSLPGVDVVADVTEGLDFKNAEAIFAEHFLEHLPIEKALDFLCEAHRVLGKDGVLRLSTPSLDWVWTVSYRFDDLRPAARRDMALVANRAFHGWGHRFLWNWDMLEEALLACGLVDLRRCRYGESEREVFRALERHETYPDDPQLPHVLIFEATKGAPQPQRLAALRQTITEQFLNHLAG